MDLWEPIDQYCERTDGSFLSEPLNFVSNLAFILVACVLWVHLRRVATSQRTPGSTYLIILIGLIGLGSGVFHSVATRWAMAADVIPIGIFLASYLYCFLRWEASLSFRGTFIGLGCFVLLTLLTASIADHGVVNGSELYFGAWTSLFGIGCYLLGRQKAAQPWLPMLGSVLFSISLALRSIDMRFCEMWPYGTHFAWHVLNAFTLYLVTKSYLVPRSIVPRFQGQQS